MGKFLQFSSCTNVPPFQTSSLSTHTAMFGLLRTELLEVTCPRAIYTDNCLEDSIKNLIISYLSGHKEIWSNIIFQHLMSLAESLRADILWKKETDESITLSYRALERSFDYSEKCLNSFTSLFQESTNWLIKPMQAFIYSSRACLRRLSASSCKYGDKSAHGHRANTFINALRALFSPCINHKPPPDQKDTTRKWGVLIVTNVLLEECFRFQNLRQGTVFTNSVETAGRVNLSDYPRPQTCAYRFYGGKLALFEGKSQRADVMLSQSLTDCRGDAYTNRKRILTALVPLRLTLGLLPPVGLLERYNLQMYKPLVEALKTGNTGLYNQTRETYQALYIKAGVYF